MSKSAGTTKNVSTTGMPVAQQPYLDMLFGEAKGNYQSGGPYYYPGQTVAGFAPAEQLAGRYLQDYASGIAAPMAERTQQSVERLTGGDALDVANNPYIKNMIASSTTGVADQLKREAFPAIRSGAQLAGQFGGSRQGIAEGTALGLATQGAQQTAAGINLAGYNTSMDSLLKGLSLSPQIQQMGYTPADMLAATGGQERAMGQANINAEMAKWQYEQNLPYVKLNEFANLVRSPTGGTSTTETQYPQASTGSQIAGGAMTGIGAFMSFYNFGKQNGWW